MLARTNRLTAGEDFRHALRRGRRAGTRTLVVHLLSGDASPVAADPARVGFAVSRAVGPAVVRNRVKRRLRHLVRERLGGLPAGTLLVVRALPAAAAATYADLGADLDEGLRRAGAAS